MSDLKPKPKINAMYKKYMQAIGAGKSSKSILKLISGLADALSSLSMSYMRNGGSGMVLKSRQA